jgi:hypothetical protein
VFQERRRDAVASRPEERGRHPMPLVRVDTPTLQSPRFDAGYWRAAFLTGDQLNASSQLK